MFAAEIEQLRAQLESTRAELRAAQRERCPDSSCSNCRKWNRWEALNGDVNWEACPTCRARAGEPCRHVGRGPGGANAPVLQRPHRGRPGELRRKRP